MYRWINRYDTWAPLSLDDSLSQWSFMVLELKNPKNIFFSVYLHYKRDICNTADRMPATANKLSYYRKTVTVTVKPRKHGFTCAKVYRWSGSKWVGLWEGNANECKQWADAFSEWALSLSLTSSSYNTSIHANSLVPTTWMLNCC